MLPGARRELCWSPAPRPQPPGRAPQPGPSGGWAKLRIWRLHGHLSTLRSGLSTEAGLDLLPPTGVTFAPYDGMRRQSQSFQAIAAGAIGPGYCLVRMEGAFPAECGAQTARGATAARTRMNQKSVPRHWRCHVCVPPRPAPRDGIAKGSALAAGSCRSGILPLRRWRPRRSAVRRKRGRMLRCAAPYTRATSRMLRGLAP